jgi:hypothetical protein
MSDTTALTDLARFIGQSQLAGDDAAAWQAAASTKSTAAQLKPKAAKRSVSDLLGVVLTLSARTRRSMLPRVEIDLDVFAPDGSRAVRILTSHR